MILGKKNNKIALDTKEIQGYLFYTGQLFNTLCICTQEDIYILYILDQWFQTFVGLQNYEANDSLLQTTKVLAIW